MSSAQTGLRANHAAMSEQDTHRIPALFENRLLTDSRGLGWRHAYATVAVERPWCAELRPLPHDCLVYCLNGQAGVEREVDDIGPAAGARLRARGVSIIPAGVSSRWSIQGTPEIMLLYLHADLKRQLAVECGLAPEEPALLTPLLAHHDALLEQICLSLMHNLRNATLQGARYADQLARTAMLHLLMHYLAQSPTPLPPASAPAIDSSPRAGIARALAYIDACLSEALTVERLAQVAGMSPAHFSEQFRNKTGYTPHSHVMRKRIDHGKVLLRTTSQPISRISLDLGFASQSHFASAFKRLTGASPGDYRKSG